MTVRLSDSYPARDLTVSSKGDCEKVLPTRPRFFCGEVLGSRPASEPYGLALAGGSMFVRPLTSLKSARSPCSICLAFLGVA